METKRNTTNDGATRAAARENSVTSDGAPQAAARQNSAMAAACGCPAEASGLDVPRLRRDIAELAACSRELKKGLRRRWQRPMGDAQRRLLAVQQDTTDRLVLLAWSRGRLHLTQRPRSGSIPGTDLLYAKIPGAMGYRQLRFEAWDYHERIGRALLPHYDKAAEPEGDVS